MEIKGFKAFNSDLTNNYGNIFLEGETYHIDGDISFGINGNGYHFCKRLEDTFRYISDDNKRVAQVTGFGEIKEGFDDYNEYYDMYSASSLTINHILEREEVLNYILHANEFCVLRFIVTGFKLTNDEILMFRNYFANSLIINKYIDYYLLNDKRAFNQETNCKILKK